MPDTKIVTLKLSSHTLKQFPTENTFKNAKKKKPTTHVKTEDTTSSVLTPAKSKKPAASSPAPEASNEGTPAPQSLGRQGLAKSENKLDKTGTQVRKWTKKPVKIQSFTGYSISFKSWKGEDSEKKPTEEKKGSGLKIQLKLNNKNLKVEDEREESPEDSGVAYSPDVSRVGTPLPN